MNHKQSTRNLFKQTFLFSFMFVVLLSSTFGANVLSNTYYGQRAYDGANPFHYTDSFEYYNYAITTNYDGEDIHNKICDIDSSGVKNLITFIEGSNTLEVYDGVSNTLNTKTDITLPSGYGMIDFVCVRSATSNEIRILAVVQSPANVKVSEYRVENNVLVETYNYLTGGVSDLPTSQLTCAEYTQSGQNRYQCVYSPTDTDYTIYMMRNFGISLRFLPIQSKASGTTENAIASRECSLIQSQCTYSNFNTFKAKVYIDSFGTKVYYMPSTNLISMVSTNDCDINLLSTTGVCVATRTSSGTIDSTSHPIRNFVQGNYNGVNVYCTLGLNIASASVLGRLNCYDSELSSIASKSITSLSASGTYGSQQREMALKMVMTDLNGDGYDDFCYYGHTSYYSGQAPAGTRTARGSGCYDIFGSASFGTITTAFPITSTIEDDGTKRILFYNYVDDTLKAYSSTSWASPKTLTFDKVLGTAKYLFEDISGNSINELIAIGETSANIGFSSAQTPPTYTLYFPYVWNYYNPSCTSENITFRMTNLKSSSKGTYISDNPDILEQTKICTTCGDTQALTCGSYSLANPSVLCTNFTSAGNYNIDFFVYSNVNNDVPVTLKNYLTEATANKLTLSLEVSDTNCGVNVDYVDSIVIGGDQIDDDDNGGTTPSDDVSFIPDVDNFFDLFGAGSTLMRFTIGMIMIIILFVLGFNITKALMGGVIFGVFGLIIATAIGLLNIWVVVFIILLMLLPILLKFIFSMQ